MHGGPWQVHWAQAPCCWCCCWGGWPNPWLGCGWLHSNYREHLTALCLAGHGVLRASSTVEQANLASGRLVPVLLDWEMMDPPPLALYYRPDQRRNARVRAFLQFVRAQFDAFALAQTAPGRYSADRPAWHRGAGRRASTWLDRR